VSHVRIDDYTYKFNAKFINDPLYGGIGLSQLEVDLINTRAFQRLRNLRQLGFLSFVFPGAEHSRFVHSLGVLCIMGKMTSHLHSIDHSIIEPHDIVRLRVAALLHDIGHYPMSHLGEAVYGFKEDQAQYDAIVVEHPGAHEDKKEVSLLAQLCRKPQNKSAHHELLGKYVVENNGEILDILAKANINPAQIGDIIVGNTDKKIVYSQLLHSSLDADRLDYLLRDSFQTGVRYGLVDLDYIIRLLCFGRDKIRILDDQDVDVVAVNKKGQHVIEHYLMSRYFHYSQIISHKTSIAFEAMAKVLFYKLINENQFILNSFQDIKDKINTEEFLAFTDATLTSCMDRYYHQTSDKDFIMFYNQLFSRRRPRTVFEIKEIGTRLQPADFSYQLLTRTLNKEFEKIVQITNVPPEHIGFQENELCIEDIPSEVELQNFTKLEQYDKKLREAIRLKDSQENICLLAWDKHSVINKLNDYCSRSIRVFYIEPPEWQDDGDQRCADINQKINQLLSH
jgi:hypothetical protein